MLVSAGLKDRFFVPCLALVKRSCSSAETLPILAENLEFCRIFSTF